MDQPPPITPAVGAAQDLQRLEALVAAGRILGGSLDLSIFDRLARLLVPTFADVCAIDLFERDGSSTRVASVHTDPSLEATVLELGRFIPSLSGHPVIASALESGTSLLSSDIDEQQLLSHAGSEEETALLKVLAIRSGIAVALRGTSGLVGVMTLGQSISGRRFEQIDLDFAEDVARQAALAAENAMLFRDVREAGDRYRTLVDGVDAIVWEAQAQPFQHVFVSERAVAILGHPLTLWLEPGGWDVLIHPDDRIWVRDRYERAGKLREDQELEYRMLAADGRVVWVHDRLFATSTGAGERTRMMGVVVDVTQRKDAELLQRAQLETTRIFAEADSPTEIPARILHAMLASLGWECGALWELEGGVLRCMEFDQAAGVHVPAFEAATWRSTFERGVGLPGRVLASRQPVWIEDVTLDQNFPRARFALDSGLHGAFAFPILAEGSVQGVLEFFSRERRHPDEDLLRVVGTIGVQMGQFIRRRQVEADLRASRTRLRAIVDTEIDGVIVIDRDGIITDVNPAAVRIFGFTADQMLGHKLAELVIPPGLRARHVASLERYLRTGEARMIGRRFEVPALRADGTEFPAELSIGVHREEGEPIFTGFIRDLTEARELERRRTALHAITRALADASSLADGTRRIIETVCRTLDWEVGLMWTVSQPDTMACIATWRRDQTSDSALIEQSSRWNVTRGDGLLGRVWETRQPLWLPDVREEPTFVRAQAAATDGLRGVFAIPVLWSGEVVGAIEFYSAEIREPDADLQRMMGGIGIQIGSFIERERRVQESAFQRTLLAAQSEATIDGLLILSPDGRTLMRNQRLVDLFQVPEEIALGGSDEAVLTAVLETLAEPDRALERIVYLYEHPDVVDRDELELRDGRVFDRYTAPVVDERGELHGRIWSFRDVTETKRTERALQEVNARTSFLADVSRGLVRTLDPREMIEDLARLAVPAVTDWCALDLVRPDGSLDRVALVHRDPEKVRVAEDVRSRGIGVELDSTAPRGVSHVILTRRSELEPEIPDEWLVEGIGDQPELLDAIRSLGFRSYVCVPLIAGDRTIGAMTWVTSESGRRYKTADLWLAEDVARRVAMALDNARLYAESAQVAHTLQQSLIPPDLPTIPGIEIAARFRPAGRGIEVGGDFYDIFSTGRGDWAIVVGDVCGKGAEAAALTALARYTLRAAAMETRRPRSIMRRLNEALMRQRTDDRFCTVAFVRLRTTPLGFRLTASSAGHPLPLVVRRDGTIEPASRPGMLLGAFPDVRLFEHSMDLSPGDAVVLFTDGVSEAGRGDEMLGEEGIKQILAGRAGAGANAIADALDGAALDRITAEQRDDIAIVVLRVEEVGTARSVGILPAGS